MGETNSRARGRRRRGIREYYWTCAGRGRGVDGKDRNTQEFPSRGRERRWTGKAGMKGSVWNSRMESGNWEWMDGIRQ